MPELLMSLQRLNNIAKKGGFTPAQKVTLQRATSCKNGRIQRRNYQTHLGEGYVLETSSKNSRWFPDYNRVIWIQWNGLAPELRTQRLEELVAYLRQQGIDVTKELHYDGSYERYWVRMYASEAVPA